MATYKHKTIRRFRVGEFEFKNHILNIPEDKPEKIAKFEELFQKLPARDKNGITQIDEAALAALERPVGQRVVKGVADHTGANKTPSTDGIQRPVAEENKPNPEEGPGGLPELQQSSGEGASTAEAPTPVKPLSLAAAAAGKKS